MRTSTSSVVIVLVVILLGLGYMFYVTTPSQDDVSARIAALSGDSVPVNPSILDDSVVKDLENLHVFGTRPVDPSQDKLSRRNPFEGL